MAGMGFWAGKHIRTLGSTLIHTHHGLPVGRQGKGRDPIQSVHYQGPTNDLVASHASQLMW
jgi:hypothetical protein